MVICMTNEKLTKYETHKEMFNELTKNGDVISNLEDGKITLNKIEDNTEIILDFFIPNIENTKNLLEEEVVEFRNELRSNLKSLIDSGINIPKEEKEKLSAKFEFIKNIK